METMAKKQPRPRGSFTPEFKAEIVDLVRQPGNTAGSVARDLNMTDTAVTDPGAVQYSIGRRNPV
jgi:transposase